LQREVEAIAFEHRQRILREEERLRTWRAEAKSQLDGREVRGLQGGGWSI
jgi:oral-facial-digital syndrome 1 protein